MTEVEQLRAAIDSLWAWMPTEQVKEIASEEPDLADLCRQIHHDLWHATTHEQRMVCR